MGDNMNEKEFISVINEIILSSTANGGDPGGPYMTKQKWARESIEKLLDLLNLNNKYHVELVRGLKYDCTTWIDPIPQIIDNN